MNVYSAREATGHLDTHPTKRPTAPCIASVEDTFHPSGRSRDVAEAVAHSCMLAGLSIRIQSETRASGQCGVEPN